MGSDGHKSHTLCKANNWALALWLMYRKKKHENLSESQMKMKLEKKNKYLHETWRTRKKNKQTKYLVADGQTPITPKYFECGCFRLVILRRFVNGQEIALTIFFRRSLCVLVPRSSLTLLFSVKIIGHRVCCAVVI